MSPTGVMAIDMGSKQNPGNIGEGKAFKRHELGGRYGLLECEKKETERGEEVIYRRRGYEVPTIKLNLGNDKQKEVRYIVQRINKL